MKDKNLLSNLNTLKLLGSQMKSLGLFNKDQSQSLKDYISDKKQETLSLSPDRIRMNVLSMLYIISTALILSGVIYFFAANWKGLDRFYKILILSGGMVLLYVGALITEKKVSSMPIIAKLLYFSGTVFFGVAVGIIGQIYNSHANSYVLFLLWLIPVIALFCLIKFEPYAVLMIILANLTLWFFYFPVMNFWVMEEYNLLLGLLLLVGLNSAIFVLGVYTQKKEFGFSIMPIAYILFHMAGHLITYKGIAEKLLIVTNILYLGFTVGFIVYFIRTRQSQFFLYTTLITIMIYLLAKYIEIIVYSVFEFNIDITEILLILMGSGILLIPISIFSVVQINKVIKRFYDEK